MKKLSDLKMGESGVIHSFENDERTCSTIEVPCSAYYSITTEAFPNVKLGLLAIQNFFILNSFQIIRQNEATFGRLLILISSVKHR